MIEINNVLKKYDLRTKSYKKCGKVIIVDSNQGRLAIKPKCRNTIYEYLDSRSFSYYPDRLLEDDNYEITRYVEEVEMPVDQKMLDMINLVSLLHSKTTFYKNVDVDEYKKIYEDLKGNIDYLGHYYNDLMTVIESKVYMSPAELMLARGISSILGAISYCSQELDAWYSLVEDKRKRRYVVIHNNLELDHFIKNKNAYLTSWDYAREDIPIYDLYHLYKKYALDFDFEAILKKYEQNYPLLEEERRLFNILISLPDKIEFNGSTYDICKKISNLLDYLFKTENIVLKDNTKNAEQYKKPEQ